MSKGPNGREGRTAGSADSGATTGGEAGCPPGDNNAGGYGRVVIVCGVLAAALIALYLASPKDLVERAGEIKAWLDKLGWAAPAVFTAGAAVLVAAGVPRLLLCAIGGLAFGFWQGLLWTHVGTVAGSYATFLFVRWGGRDFVLRRWPRIRGYSDLVSARGLVSILIARQIPVSGFLVSSLLGLTHVGHFDFLAGTAIGIVPEAIPATLVGAGVAQGSLGRTMSYLLAAAVWFVIIGLVVRRLRRRHKMGGCPTGRGVTEKNAEAEDAVKGRE